MAAEDQAVRLWEAGGAGKAGRQKQEAKCEVAAQGSPFICMG